jgi:hypothetical protein
MLNDGGKSRAAFALEASPELREAVNNSSMFDRLRNTLKKVTVDGQELFVTEGDTLLDEDQLGVYALQREATVAARAAGQASSVAGLGIAPVELGVPQGLTGMTQNGKIVRWSPEIARGLSYRIVRETFTEIAQYQAVVDGMEAATQAWEAVCGVNFEHRADLDNVPGVGSAGALFTVRFLDAGGAFIAAAFFPNDPVSRRRIVIDPSFFNPDLLFNSIGVLRHELGHVLGCRHEHIRSGAPAVCPDEPDFGVFPLTEYDPKSVMHYFCGNRGSQELAITELDVRGIQRIYGPPLSGFQFVNA